MLIDNYENKNTTMVVTVVMIIKKDNNKGDDDYEYGYVNDLKNQNKVNQDGQFFLKDVLMYIVFTAIITKRY